VFGADLKAAGPNVELQVEPERPQAPLSARLNALLAHLRAGGPHHQQCFVVRQVGVERASVPGCCKLLHVVCLPIPAALSSQMSAPSSRRSACNGLDCPSPTAHAGELHHPRGGPTARHARLGWRKPRPLPPHDARIPFNWARRGRPWRC